MIFQETLLLYMESLPIYSTPLAFDPHVLALGRPAEFAQRAIQEGGGHPHGRQAKSEERESRVTGGHVGFGVKVYPVGIPSVSQTWKWMAWSLGPRSENACLKERVPKTPLMSHGHCMVIQIGPGKLPGRRECD